MEFSDKKVGEQISVGIDFIRHLVGGESIVSQTVSASVLDGVDAIPAALLNGIPSLDGSTIWQNLIAGQPNVYYTLEFTATTNAIPPHIYIERATLKVIP